MAANSFGTLLRVTSFGESHGPAIGCVVDGCPPGLALTESDIQQDLDRRKPGRSRYVSQRRESDKVEILSGVFSGMTTGTPIALLIRNEDQRSQDYGDIANLFRPGHADYSMWQKFGIRDYRGSGRASARETAARVAAGAIARKWLHTHCGVHVRGYLSRMGNLSIPFRAWEDVDNNPFFAPDMRLVPALEALMQGLGKDSIGAEVTVTAQGVPPGWGDPVFDRLDARIAYALMGINAVKGVEIGAGFASVAQHGSEHGDVLTPQGFASNNAGGILGGISTGQDIVARMALKPTSSIAIPRPTMDIYGAATTVVTKGRHDPCVGLRATPIAEAMLALTLMDAALCHRAQCADVHCPTPPIAAMITEATAETLAETMAQPTQGALSPDK